ncbi:hypothetical protein [Aequorivita viscosa]|uniref:Addiction module component n=1 Tax=Aequorivita viscosa TaxID=797419 RepID=A0A1M6MYF4_9FLAO|nr:hypothetical protein [Aequorivita viscosa]SDX39322.1 hypothetical protein SAMN05216556_12811 [Aequorivita viscosa]SHJ88476.1 hypothetical protein SAMN04487908_13011 [Aequorivita viscosa]HLW33870.1 hypothetical protein [Aequorivita sp.]
MNLEARKIEFVQEFLKIQSEEVVSKLEKLLRKESTSLTNNQFEPMTMEDFNDRIDKSMEDSKNGRIIKAVDLKVKIDKWN